MASAPHPGARHPSRMSLRTKIVLLNAAVLAIALAAAAVAVGGVWAALGPFHRAVEAEARAVTVAEQLGLTPAQTNLIESALAAAQREERLAASTALVATAVPVALLAGGGIVCAALSLRFSRHLLTRLSALRDGTLAVAGGDRHIRLPEPSPAARRPAGDELDHLLASFNRMVGQLAEAERRARESDALKTTFLSGVSHDLRTPLTTIAGLLESLRREEWDDSTRGELLEVAHREAQRLSHLVSDLLDLTRIESHAWPLEPEPVDLATLTSSIVADLSLPGGPLVGRHVALRAGGTGAAWGDEEQLRRVLLNLLTNAAHYSPAGTPIEVDVAADPASHTLRVAVADRGPGISPQDAPRIFDRFYRGAAGAARADGHATHGTGLGLDIARGIVEAHGGRIWVEHPPGGGARFVFTVPTTASAAQPASAPLLAPAGPLAR